MNETIEEFRKREKKEITWFFCGIGSIFIWTLLFVITVSLKLDENITHGILLLSILLWFFGVYCFVKSNLSTSSIHYPIIPRAPRVQRLKKKKKLLKKIEKKYLTIIMKYIKLHLILLTI